MDSINWNKKGSLKYNKLFKLNYVIYLRIKGMSSAYIMGKKNTIDKSIINYMGRYISSFSTCRKTLYIVVININVFSVPKILCCSDSKYILKWKLFP